MGRKGKETTVQERRIIINSFCKGKSYAEISAIVQRPITTIKTIIYRHGGSGFLRNKPRAGRPKKLTARKIRFITRETRRNPRLSAPKINGLLEGQLGSNVSDTTIRRTLYEDGYHGRVARRKPFISKVNQENRIEYAKDNVDKDQEYWNTVLFTDESKYNIFQSDGHCRVWRRVGTELDKANLKGTVKHGGGSVMVWGCMSAAGAGRLVFIEGKMDHKQYIKILQENLLPSVTKLGIQDNYIFSQDNDPKHTAINTRLWLLYNARKQIKTPAQ